MNKTIKTKTLKITTVGYTLIAEFAEGEGQVVIVGSPGQSGAWFLHMVLAGCDGGYSTVKNHFWDFPYGQVKRSEDGAAIAKVLQEIGFFTTDESAQILAAWHKHWNMLCGS